MGNAVKHSTLSVASVIGPLLIVHIGDTAITLIPAEVTSCGVGTRLLTRLGIMHLYYDGRWHYCLHRRQGPSARIAHQG